MKCSAVNNLLSAYLDGELADFERGVVEEHLRGCASCAALLRSLKASVALVSSLPRQPAPAGFAREVQERIEPPAAARPQAAPRVAVAPRRRLIRLLPRYAAAAVILLSVAAVGYVTLRPYTWVPVAPGGYAPGRLDERLAMESDHYFSDEDGRKARQAPEPGNERLKLGLDAGRQEKDLDMTAGERIARAPSGSTLRQAVEEGWRYKQSSADLEPEGGASAKRLLDRDDAWKVKGAEVRLAAAPVHVRIRSDDVANGVRVVKDLLTANGWMANEALEANGRRGTTTGQPEDLKDSSRIEVAVPEGQMLGFIRTLGSRQDIRVAELDFGEAKVLGSSADEISRLARGMSTEAARGRVGAPRPAAPEAAKPEGQETAGEPDVSARLSGDMADRRAPAPPATTVAGRETAAVESRTADEPAPADETVDRLSAVKPKAEEEPGPKAVHATGPASRPEVAEGGKWEGDDQRERERRTRGAGVAGPSAAPAPAPTYEDGHTHGGVCGPGAAPAADGPEGVQAKNVPTPTTRRATTLDEKRQVELPDRLKEVKEALAEPSATFAAPMTERPADASEPVRREGEQALRYARESVLGDIQPAKDESREGPSHGVAASRPSSGSTGRTPAEGPTAGSGPNGGARHRGIVKPDGVTPTAEAMVAPAELDKMAADRIDTTHLFRAGRPTTKAALAKEGRFGGGQGGGAPAEPSAPASGLRWGELERLRRPGELPPLVYHVTIVIERAPAPEAPAASKQ